jgi:hypothetical protein
MPLTISTSHESGLESSASLLPSLNDLSTLREMLRLPDRESSPEEIDDDDGLEHLFWIPPGVESLSNSLRLSSPALKPPPQSLCPPPQIPCPLSPSQSLYPLSPPQSLCPLSPPHSLCPLSPSQSLCLLPPPKSCVSYPYSRVSVPCSCLYPRHE